MILLGDCREVMRTLDAESVDAIVCDPPYELGFMGKKWDSTGVAFDVRTWAEALRVAKPGAYLAAFGGTRTFHRLACAIEDAGWELRDCVPYAHEGVHLEPIADCPWLLAWVYGSGFPKSTDRKKIPPAWDGWNTALKPAWEPIILARKPLIGSVAENLLEHGTGALNIDGCRVGDTGARNNGRAAGSNGIYGEIGATTPVDYGMGRWPANLVHDGSDEVLAAFPDAPGQQGDITGKEPSRRGKNTYGEYGPRAEFKARRDGEASAGQRYTDAGGTNFAPLPGMRRESVSSAARFFYCAKAGRADRNDGCDGMPEGMTRAPNGAENAVGSKRGSRSTPRANIHPTVKPTDLMRWLCRLVTPTGGLILDPFTGSGSTGRGAVAEGFRFVGIELSPEYAAIAEARIRAAMEQRAADLEQARLDAAQLHLFATA